MPEPVDPFDALDQPVVPIDPRPAFVAELRARLASALGLAPDGGTTMPTATTFIPAGYHSVSIGLSVDDAHAAIAFYHSAFGAELVGAPYVDADGRVGHAELRIGDSTFSLNDEWRHEGNLAPATAGGTTVQLTLYVEDCDAVFARAVAAGATVWREPELAPYGARSAKVRDPFGHNWFIQTQVQDVSDAELAAALAEGGFVPDDQLRVGSSSDGAPAPSDVVDLGRRADAGPPPSRAIDDRRGELFYFTLGSTDVGASSAFFGSLLGWELEENDPGSFHIANIPAPGGLHGDERASRTLYFVVPDIHAAADEARRLGAHVDEPVQYGSGWTVRLVAPGGVEVWLSVPAPGY